MTEVCTHCKKAPVEEEGLRYCHPCYLKFLRWLEEGGSRPPESVVVPVKKKPEDL